MHKAEATKSRTTRKGRRIESNGSRSDWERPHVRRRRDEVNTTLTKRRFYAIAFALAVVALLSLGTLGTVVGAQPFQGDTPNTAANALNNSQGAGGLEANGPMANGPAANGPVA